MLTLSADIKWTVNMNTYVGTIVKIEGHYILTGRNENQNVCQETLG